MKLIEKVGEFSDRFKRWNGNENLANYPFCRKHARTFYAPAARSSDA